MKKEFLARWIVLFLIILAVAIPFSGNWISSHPSSKVIELHARMPESGGWSIDTISAKVGQPINLRLTSDDVVHSFALGQSDRAPLEILPGEFVETSLTFDRPGKYTFYCVRWCGPNHWRMRGTIEVAGPGEAEAPDPQALFLKLGIDVDAPHQAEVIPESAPSIIEGAKLAGMLPSYATDRDTYLKTSPSQLWQKLRGEPTLAKLSDTDLWDAVSWIWQSQTTPNQLANAEKLYTTNCAACHGETGKGDGVMVRGLPAMDHTQMGHGLVRPPDFTNRRQLLGASPALLEGKMIRGGMGTGMPYWGPIFTNQQMDSLIAYLYTFAFKPASKAVRLSN